MNKFLKHPIFTNWKFWLVAVLILCSFTRFWRLGMIKEYVFDEVYHAFTAKMFAMNRYEAWVWWESPPDGVAYEWTHPPLAKVIMSWGVQMFGGPGELPTKVANPQAQYDVEEEKKSLRVLTPDSFGWRFFSAVFGVLGTFALFLFTSSIFRNKWVGVFAAFLFTFDLLPLVQSRTAMNDIFAVTFMLFAYYFFTKRTHLLESKLPWWNWLLSGLFVGAAIASKWTSLFTLGVFAMYHFATIIYGVGVGTHSSIKHKIVAVLRNTFGQGLWGVLCLGVLPYIVYMLSYWQMFTMPIHDYKGNALKDVLQTGIWAQERDGLKREVAEATDAKARKDIEKRLGEKERQIAFWSRLDSTNSHFADRYFIWWGVQKQMWWYHTNLKATHNYTSQWWTWPLNVRPVWFYVKYCTNPDDRSDDYCNQTYDAMNNQKTVGDIYTMGNPFIFWFIIPTICLLTYQMVTRYRGWFYALIPATIFILGDYAIHAERTATEGMSAYAARVMQAVLPQIFLFSLLLALFLVFVQLADSFITHIKAENNEKKSIWHNFVLWKDVVPIVLCLVAFAGYWLPWARSPRIMFFYHFFPPVAFFYPLLAYCLYRIFSYSKTGRHVALIYCSIVVVSFAYFYPHVTGWQLPEPTREQYYWFTSWK